MTSIRLYLKNATFIDWKTLKVSLAHLAVEEGLQGKTRLIAKIPGDAKNIINCSRKIVTKSFAISHHHIYSTLARGMPPPTKTPRNFVEILKFIWWNLDKKLDAEMIRASALFTAIEAAKCGVTFVIDHHSSPNAVAGSLGVIASAMDEVGLSHLLCYELSDRDGRKTRDKALKETDDYLGHHQGLVGLHASSTVSDGLLEQAINLARSHRTGLHVHVAEDLSDQEHCLKVYGQRVLERFKKAGVLDSHKTILAHGIHLNDAERQIFKESRSWVAHNPESNQNNNVGVFDPKGLGPRILLGTDGMHSDILASVKAAYLGEQAKGGLSPLEAYRRLRRAHEYLALNNFKGDGDNNLVILDYNSPTPVTSSNWPSHVIYGLNRACVESVISQGRLIIVGRRLVKADEEKIFEFSRKQAQRLWRRL